MEYKKALPIRIKKKLEKLEYTTESDLFDKLDDNEASLKQTFANCTDLIVRKINIFDSIPCMLVYLQVLVDSIYLDEGLLKPLMQNERVKYENASQLIERMEHELVSIAQTKIINNMKEIVMHIVKGDVVLLVESSKQAIATSVKAQLHRALKEPDTEALIRGPRLGFIEDININMALIRQRIRTPQLKMEQVMLGTFTNTEVVITYIENIAPQKVISEVKERILQINMDSVLESGYVEEMIRDAPYSPFPVIQMTERPDSVSASLLEGKVAILINGTPMALIVPVTFWHGFQTVEDYYMNYIFATVIRWLRYLFGLLSLTLPSLFIAVTTFHQEMIPINLTLSLAAARETVPFPTLVETLIMEITFEALREAGIRLPRAVGQTISIVGALVLGQAAVQAGLVSAPIIIIVSLTGIASFLIPNNNMSQAIRILRFPLMILAGTFGLYGVSAALIAVLIHLVNLRSFGVYYMTPLAPLNLSGLWDVLGRAPWWILHKRQHRVRSKQEMENK